MSPSFAQKHKLRLQEKKESYSLKNFDESIMKYNEGLVNKETQLVHLRIEQHSKKLRLDITELSGSDIVLGISWLRSANSLIDWVNETIAFLDTGTTQLYSILQPSKGVDIFAMTAKDMSQELRGNQDAQVL